MGIETKHIQGVEIMTEFTLLADYHQWVADHEGISEEECDTLLYGVYCLLLENPECEVAKDNYRKTLYYTSLYICKELRDFKC